MSPSGSAGSQPLRHRHFAHHFDHAPPKALVTRSGRFSEIRSIVHLTKPYKRLAALTWGATALRGCLLLLIPVLAKVAIDSGILQGDATVLFIACATSILLIVAATGLALVSKSQGIQLADKVTVSLQTELFAHLETLSRAQLEAIGTGALLSRVANDAPVVRMLFVEGANVVIRYGVAVAGSLILMLSMDWQLTIVVLMFLPVTALITTVYRRAVRPWYLRSRDTIADVTGVAHESFAVMPIVHGYSQEARQTTAFEVANVANRASQFRPMVYQSVFGPATAFVSSAALGALIIFGGLQAVDGKIQIGTIVAFIGLAAAFLGGVVGAAGVASVYAAGIAAVQKCLGFLAIAPDVDEPDRPVAVPPGPLEVVVDAASFQQSADGPLLVDAVDLVIPAGGRVAIVGDTGAGCAALARMVARLLTPTAGRITYGGVDITQLDLRQFHDRVRFVDRDPYVFEATLADNLCMAKPDATDRELAEVISRIGGPNTLSSFADGLDTRITAGGRNLSSGQVAIIGLVRALLNQPDVLVIDGSLDRFDPDVADALRARVHERAGGMTVMLTTRRADIARSASSIVVLKAGRIVQVGTYEELMSVEGPFSRLKREQDAPANWSFEGS